MPSFHQKYYHADIYTNYDDIATEQCTFMSPETYRAYIKPLHKKLYDAVRAHDMIPMQHTCGKAEALIQDFIDTGAAAWASVQPTNDIEGLLKKYGRIFCLSGGYNTAGRPGQIDATPEEITGEVCRCVDTYGRLPGFMFFGFKIANSLDSKENQAAIFPLIREAASYRHTIQVEF